MVGEHVPAPARGAYRPAAHRGRAVAVTLSCHAVLLLLLMVPPANPYDLPPADRALSVFDLPPPDPEEVPPPPPPRTVPPLNERAPPVVAGGSPPRAARPVPDEPAPDAPASPPAVDVLASPTLVLDGPPIPIAGVAAALSLGGSDGVGGGHGGTGTGMGRGDGTGPGSGAGRYFLPRWIVPPGQAELGPVTPPIMRRTSTAGYGVLACRSRPPGSVRGCRVVGEHPEGSGYGAAARRASPRFRVRPPEIGGKPVAGAWLLIRIDWVYPKPGATVAAR